MSAGTYAAQPGLSVAYIASLDEVAIKVKSEKGLP